MPDILLRVPSGSRLYNTHHAGSDYDWFEVYPGKGRTYHRIDRDRRSDTVRMSLDTFLIRAAEGSPQALEAMWSRRTEVDCIPYLRLGFHPNVAGTVETYRRTIKAFWLSGDPKRRVHAHRLEVNLGEFLRRGIFDPTLADQTVDFIRCLVGQKIPPASLRT